VQSQVSMAEYNYDLFVIGGGSGGVAASKLAAELGARTAVADFVKPSPAGTTWGLGGTCVNVGCIPKKLMHTSAGFREAQNHLSHLGWDTKSVHSWEAMITKIDDYIKELNAGAETGVKDKGVKYYNKFATFVDAHTVELDDGKGGKEQVTSKYFLIACGGRPNLGGYPGVEECCISSDDIFWHKKAPGKTLVVGASYIALECAGFLTGLGFDTTVMVRSIFLRGFDQECANKISDYMAAEGTKFVRGKVPSKFEKTESGQVRVYVDDKEFEVYDTVLMAVGRTGCAGWLNCEAAGIDYIKKDGKIKCNNEDQSNVPHIYCCGDVIAGRPELTPVAVQAGKLCVKRLFGNSKKLMDYEKIATTVFTPLEYGVIGLCEEDAVAKFGYDKLTIYHSFAKPLEWNVSKPEHEGFLKLICDKENDEKIIGMHILGTNVGEMTQGFGVAIKAGFTKEMLDDTVGIHPTFAEALCNMHTEKIKGAPLVKVVGGGCSS